MNKTQDTSRVMYTQQNVAGNSKSKVLLVENEGFSPSGSIKEHKFFGLTLIQIIKALTVLSIISIVSLIVSIAYIIQIRTENKIPDVHVEVKPNEVPDITIDESIFGKLSNNEEVKKYVLRNKNGFEVSLLTFGATIKSIKTKDRNGKFLDVVLGLNTLEEYMNRSLNPYLGSTVGRTTNRITNAEFTLNGVKYILEKNNGENNLHGGLKGFDMQNWHGRIEDNTVKFHLYSKDNEGGFPGNVDVEVFYKIDPNKHLLSIEYRATTTKDTPLDLTNHAYFNLNGHDSAVEIYNHELRILADNYLDSNPSDLLVTGEIKPVVDTKYDFRNYVKLGDRIKNNTWPSEGYDNYFINNQQHGKKYVASVRNPSNGVKLDIWSDQNGVQFYTANFLNVTIPSSGLHYSMHNGFCLETHNYPDAVNKFKFPSSILKPEGEYSHKTIWLFSVEN